MSDITSLNNQMAGANPAMAKLAPGARPAPEPPTIQNAVGQPLNTAQAAVTQPPTSGTTEWKREADPDGGQRDSASSAESARRQLVGTVKQLNQHMLSYDTHLQFEIDDASQRVIVRIVDRETHEVVRQIPSKTALALAAFFDDLAEQQRQAMPSGGAPGGDDNKSLKMEGLLLKVMV